MEDLASSFIGIGWGNGIGVFRGLGEALAGTLTGDVGRAADGLKSTGWALVPRYGMFSGPDYGGDFEGLAPITPIDVATYRHDQSYADLDEKGVPFLSLQRSEADRALISDMWKGHRLGPVGQAYRVGLTAAFWLKIGVQSL
jgi:hypothetical protein